jgi:hypothetical protein
VNSAGIGETGVEVGPELGEVGFGEALEFGEWF